MFPSFFSFLARSCYLFFLCSFIFTLWFTEMAKSTWFQVLFFLLINTKSGLLAEIWWSFHISKSHRILCILFSRTDSGFYIYHLSAWWNFSLLPYSQWVTFPTDLCLFLCFLLYQFSGFAYVINCFISITI